MQNFFGLRTVIRTNFNEPRILMKKVTTLLLLVGGLMLGAGTTQLKAQNGSEEKPTITIVEYSDYQCPACAYFHPIVKKLKDKYGDQINMNYKFYPLNSHRFSFLAARAAQAAKNQGKFLEMHNLLFKNQEQWSQSSNPAPTFVNYARKLNLDIEQFRNELNSRETQKAVVQQKQEGRRAGVRATPTFIIEGEKISSLPKNFAEFDKLVQKYLQEKKQKS